jgi:hypothetical protein
MAIETIGEAYEQGWRVTVRCAWGPRDGMKRHRECVYGGELDMLTLVWTRGRDLRSGCWRAACVAPAAAPDG